MYCYVFQGTYQDYISADEEVKQLLVDINKLVEENSEETKVGQICNLPVRIPVPLHKRYF